MTEDVDAADVAREEWVAAVRAARAEVAAAQRALWVRLMLGRVIALAQRAPGLTDDQLAAGLAELGLLPEDSGRPPVEREGSSDERFPRTAPDGRSVPPSWQADL
jgi:hypothetical protein